MRPGTHGPSDTERTRHADDPYGGFALVIASQCRSSLSASASLHLRVPHQKTSKHGATNPVRCASILIKVIQMSASSIPHPSAPFVSSILLDTQSLVRVLGLVVAISADAVPRS